MGVAEAVFDNDWVLAMGRKRNESVKQDRLRSIVLGVLFDDHDLDPAKLARQIGYEPGGAAAQAIRRWSGERWEKSQKGEPGDSFARPLNWKYRVRLFSYVRRRHWDEYIKPLPVGEGWLTAEERERWFYDTRTRMPLRRSPEFLDDFLGFLKVGGIITQATRTYVRAEMHFAGGEGKSQDYDPPDGLTVDDYRRLITDDLLFETQEELAWAVIDNLLWQEGLLRSQIGNARHLIPEGALIDLIEQNSFEAVAAALSAEIVSGGTPRS